MKHINPKNHDAIFKWLIAAFTREFFSHYFPGIRIGNQLLFINRWAELYGKISAHNFDRIRKEFQMDMIETTICEHIYNQGKFEGILQGEILGQVKILEELHRQRVLSKKKLAELMTDI